MSNKTSRHVAFVAFKKIDNQDFWPSVRIGPNLKDMQDWVKPTDSSTDTDKKATNPKILSSKETTASSLDPSDDLENLMSRFQIAISGFQHLIRSSAFMIPALRSAYIHAEMFRAAKKELESVELEEGGAIFGVTEEQYSKIDRHISRLHEYDQAQAVLPGAILLSLVATFDSFIADTVKIMFRHNSERLVNSDKSILIKDLFSMNSFEEAIKRIVDNEVDALMRGSHDEQIKFIEKNFNINIRDNYDNWSKFIEIFERRNLVAHGNCIVNVIYVGNLQRNKVDLENIKVGDELKLTQKYLSRSANHLMEFGILLMFVLWRKNFQQDKEKAFSHLNSIAYELIKDKRYFIAARILDFVLHKQSADVDDRTKKIMIVNLANALKKSKNNKRAQEIIDAVDWSSSSIEFNICIAALKDDVPRFVSLMPQAVSCDAIKKSDFREWPVFDWVRNDEAVLKKFYDIFDEHLILPSEQKEEAADDFVSPKEENVIH